MARIALRWLLAAGFLIAGVLHIRDTDTFLKIVPAWVPLARATVIATGFCEVAGAIGLMIPRTRWWAGLMLAIYAVCVFPANIKHAMDALAVGGLPASWWYHGPRLLFQPVIVWWALFAGGVIDWPFRRASNEKGRPSRDGLSIVEPDRPEP